MRKAILSAVLAAAFAPPALAECSYERGGNLVDCLNGRAVHAYEASDRYVSAGAIAALLDSGCAEAAKDYCFHSASVRDAETQGLRRARENLANALQTGALGRRWPRLARFVRSSIAARGHTLYCMSARHIHDLGVRYCGA